VAAEPGQPWLRMSGSGPGSGERTCRKRTLVPSMVVMNCRWELIRQVGHRVQKRPVAGPELPAANLLPLHQR
jgi:hypothetical protein